MNLSVQHKVLTKLNQPFFQNAVAALGFEKNQILNFQKQKARVRNQNRTTGNKLGKKGEFEDAAKYLLQALGTRSFTLIILHTVKYCVRW